MKNRITIGLLGLVLFLILGSAKPTLFNSESVLIIHKIRIDISGGSTVGDYNCSNTFYKRDTIILNLKEKNKINAEIPVINFDCGNKLMTKDLQKTVKSKIFPNSYVSITDIKPYNKNYKCNLTFLITNRVLKYKDFILYKTDNKIQGTINLNFSDIDLHPPVKMAGLIKVKDQIVVDFSLYKN